mmetsp:Transcript_19892/g.22768  ORF Transcript_19892/g.22768 Transcript_19892/m.22768 type:complete len:1149 (-) Transcript_19892:4-3450(-)
MFDGDFRSRRREVNLSGNRQTGDNSSSKGGSGRRNLLKNAEVQRKQRQERIQREKAAIILQSVTRGVFQRLRTVQQCLMNLTAEASSTSSTKLAALSVCLSYHSLLTKFNTNRTDLLLNFQTYINNNKYNSHIHEDKACIDTEKDHPQPTDVVDDHRDDSFSGSWFSQKRMIRHTLVEFDPYRNTNETNKKLHRLLENYRESTRIDEEIFLKLTACMKIWRDDTESPSWSHAKEYDLFLTKWAIKAHERLENPNAKAYLATILLCSSNYNCNSNDRNSSLGADQFEKWFTPLAEILLRGDGDDSSSKNFNTMDLIQQATLENLRSTHVQRLLSNLLDSTKSPQLVLLINYVLCQPQNEKLKLAVSLLARGDSLVGKQQNHDYRKNNGNNNSWDIDQDSEFEEEVDHKPSSHKKARGGSTQYKRQEILTLVKLDKLYNERIQQSTKDQQKFDSTTIEVATKIVKAPWKEWGLHVLGKKRNIIGSDKDNEKERYVETLGFLLQASSSMRPIPRVTPLSPLAFNHAILKALWNYIQEQQCGVVLSIFADLFSHYLVALSDEDFIKYHCDSFSEGAKNIIMARDLVVRYGQVLHEVYWTKPVVSNEIQIDNVRGRLILSGTKIWNSIYERWNRLVKTSFCEENSWWFPHIGSKEGDRAVIPDRERGYAANEDDDDDDDDDSMDIDEDQNQQLSTAEEESDALADSFRDPKMARVLTCIPQALPFQRRVKLFHSLLRTDKQKTVQAFASRRALMAMGGQRDDDDVMMWLDGSVREQIKIRRCTLYKDSMEQLNKLGASLKHKIQVTFVNKHGAEEPGIDGGGVFKEFLDDLIKDGFAPRNDDETEGGAPRLFSITPKQQQLTMNLDLAEDRSMLVHYEFLGRVLAKSVYESVLVEPQFCLPFLNQLMGKLNTLEDLKNYDDEYYNNLNKLHHFEEEEIDSLGLAFELTVRGTTPNSVPRTVDLVPSGRSIAVTKKNVFLYTQAVANEILNVLGAHQTRAFLRGFRDLIPVSWVRLFSAKELQKLISGDDSVRGIDVSSLKRATQYLGGYHESQPYILDFWDILENELSFEQQRKFLRFMTSCSRQPLLGFSSLEPFPAIQQIRLRDDERSKNSRLPTSSTCMNLLKLPNYEDRNLLKQKLLAAVESGTGFELT